MVDAADLAFVNAWQRGFPLRHRPFKEIGRMTSLSELAVLDKFARLKSVGVIDRVGPVFRPNTVGASMLAAMAVAPERLDEVAAQVSAQPGVNHNYERENALNLWFVVTGPDAATVQRRISRLEQAAGLPVVQLPLLEEFHIDLGFDLQTGEAPRAAPKASSPASAPRAPLTVTEKRLVERLSKGFALAAEPYAALAAEAEVSEDEILFVLRRMLADGRIRRIGAVVRHRRLGYDANAMVVWDIPDVQAGAASRRLAEERAVTLCYRRARARSWPYNVYCMLHGRSREAVLPDIDRITASCGLGSFPRAILFSRRCFSQKAASYA